MSTSVTESMHAAEFLLSEAEGSRSREIVSVASGNTLAAGTVIGKATVATTVSAPAFSGTGNGAITMDGTHPVQPGAIPGDYTIRCTVAVTNGGEFEVIDPNGFSLGSVKVGGTFNNQIKFAIADGGTDFVVGDFFTATVAAGTGKVVAVPASTAYDGTSKAYGVLYAAVDASAAATDGVAIVRDAEVDKNHLTFTTTSLVTSLSTQLGALGVIVRS